MNIIRNDKMIKRNARIGTVTMFGGLGVLGLGMFISFRYPTYFSFSLLALMLGFMLSQVGIFYQNRWGRRPRLDELLDASLKGLDKKFTIYHYSSPASHLLVGPSGLWVLMPYYQRGTITFEKGRWRQKGGGIGLQYLKLFAQEGLGRPDIEASGEVENLQKYLKKQLSDESIPPVQAALVFTHPKAEISIAEDATPPYSAVTLKDLKELVRKAEKGKGLSVEKLQVVQDAFTTG